MQQNNQGLFESVLALTIHDIKNSLSLLLEKMQQEGGAANAGVVSQYEIRRINNNLVRLLGLYRLGSDHYHPQFESQSLSDLLDEIAADYQEMLEYFQLEMEMACDDDLQGEFDKQLLYSVMENAVNNACRYSKAKIGLSAQIEGSWLQVVVEDDGEGFPEAFLEFNESLSEEQPYNPSAGTTGLGFYFASVVAQQHRHDQQRGYIKLDNESSLGGGRFVLVLPYAEEQAIDFDFFREY